MKIEVEKSSEVIISKIRAGIRKRHEAEKAKHSKKIHYSPTDAGKCPRALWYEWKGFPKEEPTDEELSVFIIGTITHEFIQEVLKTEGQLCSEFRIEKEWNGFPTSGYADSIILTDGGIVVVDFKTIKEYGLKFVEKAPKKEHEMQVTMYMDELGLKTGYVLYWGKDTGTMIEHVIKHNPELIKEIIKLFKLVRKCLDENELPKAKCKPGEYPCKYCKYGIYCKEDITGLPEENKLSEVIENG